MRTKTLLLTAVAGLAGVASATAQVYSVNAVGYVNKTLKAGFNQLGNPLDAGAGNNTVSKLLTGVPQDTTVYKYTGTTYDINSYDTEFGWGNPDMTMNPGEGAFVRVPSDVTVTFVGEVMQGNLTIQLPAGFAMVASKVPQAGKLQTDLKYPASQDDTIYEYMNPGGYVISTYDAEFGWAPSEPELEVGQAFWSRKAAAASWARTFSVNP